MSRLGRRVNDNGVIVSEQETQRLAMALADVNKHVVDPETMYRLAGKAKLNKNSDTDTDSSSSSSTKSEAEGEVRSNKPVDMDRVSRAMCVPCMMILARTFEQTHFCDSL